MLVSHIRNGKLTEAWLMSEDQYAADEFFSQALVDLHSGRRRLGAVASRLPRLDPQTLTTCLRDYLTPHGTIQSVL